MIILDTNVLSALMRQPPEQRVFDWLKNQPITSIWITAITVVEIRFGAEVLPLGRRRALLLQGFAQLLERISHRVVPFDDVAAEQAANLMASRQRRGRLGELRDTMIAGIALAHHASLATRNPPHFDDTALDLINPWLS